MQIEKNKKWKDKESKANNHAESVFQNQLIIPRFIIEHKMNGVN
jgi:hypothetical protein